MKEEMWTDEYSSWLHFSDDRVILAEDESDKHYMLQKLDEDIGAGE